METLVARFERHLRDHGFELVETHLSRVFLGPRDVYKFKRPVNLGFVDFTTRGARKDACEAELALNRRLAPDVYLDVLCLWHQGHATDAPTAHDEWLHETAPADPQQDHEWLVHMRRLPDATRADVLLAKGDLGLEEVDQIASMLVRFHRTARCDRHTTEFGRKSCIEGNVEENFQQIAPDLSRYLRPEEAQRLFAAQRGFLAEHGALFEARCQAGRVRDGHGDLRLEHLYREGRDGSFLAIDCIEFNERFRFADVCADLAFLVMDLAHHGRRDLAERLVLRYALESGDYGRYRLLDFYVSYRATVRAKVTGMLAADPDVNEATRARAAAEARRYYLLALAAESAPLEPACLVAMTGGIASGKSTLAEAVASTRHAPVLVADRVRKELLGVPLTQPLHSAPFQGAYDEVTSARVYDELLRRADDVLASGRSVVLDASFRSRAHREQVLALAERHGVRGMFVECRCSEAAVHERLRTRALAPSVSDGRSEIERSFQQSFEPLELPAEAHCVIDTERPLADNVAQVLNRLFA
jgi:aminoglycoside phosphotransferase family enzyme/predicted kinase